VQIVGESIIPQMTVNTVFQLNNWWTFILSPTYFEIKIANIYLYVVCMFQVGSIGFSFLVYA